MKYGLKILLFHLYFERKFEIGKYSNRLRKFTETCQILKCTDKIYLNYKILRTEIWNISESWNMGPYLSIFESL